MSVWCLCDRSGQTDSTITTLEEGTPCEARQLPTQYGVLSSFGEARISTRYVTEHTIFPSNNASMGTSQASGTPKAGVHLAAMIN